MVNSTKALNANLEPLKLDVVTIAPLHGPVVSIDELKKVATMPSTVGIAR
jgi:hypothetical protein